MSDLYRVNLWIEVIADNSEDAEEYVSSVIRHDRDDAYSLINDFETVSTEQVS